MNAHASMNRIYRLVWSQVRGTWIPVAETARGRGKGGRAARRVAKTAAVTATAALCLTWMPCVLAGPTGGQIVSGKGNITQSGTTTDIHQSSQNLSIDWLSFNVAPSETVDFIQPSASAIAVNRIGGNTGSEILGHLESNGQVYLINPNGVLFGAGSVVDVGGLVASTLAVSDASLSSASRSFAGSGTGSVVNEGTITVAPGGSVALVGNHVSNQGVISAQLGTVAVGAGSAVTLTFAGDSLVHLSVDRSVLNSLAENHGLIQADGGQVLMTAGARDALLASVVNNSGVIEARTVQNHAGSITLLGGMSAGTVTVGGVLDASAADGGDGGHVETSAARVELDGSARITTAAAHGQTGIWLIDPVDYTVAPSGGDMTGAQLTSALSTSNVSISSSGGHTAGTGSINIDDTVSWKANKLTLTAADNVNVNAVMTASGSAALALNPATANTTGTVTEAAVSGGAVLMGLNSSGFTGTVNFTGSGTLSISGTPYTVINSLGAAGSTTGTDLQGINGKLAGHYVLGSNINAAATSGWNSGAGFNPIGNSTTAFTGIFNGLGHTITGLAINRSTQDVGLFGSLASSAAISNVGLVGGSVSGGSYYVGGLAGFNSGAGIANSFATGSVKASYGLVGGLVGYNNGAISNSYATGSVSNTGGSNDAGCVGGLVGDNSGAISNSYATGNVSDGGNVGGVGGLVGVMGGNNYIINSYAMGQVKGEYFVGGLVGENASPAIVSNSSATGQVSGLSDVGGLVGLNEGTVQFSYATGKVIESAGGSGLIGGLVGFNGQTIADSYATGQVSGVSEVGGLVGTNTGTVMASYAKGQVSGSTDVGGLVGNSFNNEGTVRSSYWDVTSSGQSTSAGGTGLTSTQMMTASNFGGFTFTKTPGAAGWVLVDADGTMNNYGGAAGAMFPMLGTEYSTTIKNAHQLQLMAMNPAGNYSLGQNIDAIGTTASGTDVWSSEGFVPIANFDGSFNGLGHTIQNLSITTPRSNVGLFGSIGPAGVVSNVGLVGGSVLGSANVGALVGFNNYGTVSNSYSTASVGSVGGTTSNDYTGGLVGNNFGTVANSYAAGSVASVSSFAGGLIGVNQPGATVTNSHATGSVNVAEDSVGRALAGGLVGGNYGAVISSFATGAVNGLGNTVGGLAGGNYGTISNSYATGAVSGQSYDIGGLVGYNFNPGATGIISHSYATGKVSGSAGSRYVGGFVGFNYGETAISNSYATGAVTGSSYVGGFAGKNVGAIADSYAAGKVSGSTNVGGFAGENDGTMSANFWDKTTSGQSAKETGAIGMSTADMQNQANFTSATTANGNVNPGWDFTTIWTMQNGNTYPTLR
jgi:filamentous hemagglutinin family protein